MGAPEVVSGPSDVCCHLTLDWSLQTIFTSPRFYSKVQARIVRLGYRVLQLIFQNIGGAVVDLNLGRFNIKEISVLHLVAFHHPSKACIWLRDFYIQRQEGKGNQLILFESLGVLPLTDRRPHAF